MKAFLVSFAASALCLSVNLPAQDAKPPSQGIDIRPRIYLTPADVATVAAAGHAPGIGGGLCGSRSQDEKERGTNGTRNIRPPPRRRTTEELIEIGKRDNPWPDFKIVATAFALHATPELGEVLREKLITRVGARKINNYWREGGIHEGETAMIFLRSYDLIANTGILTAGDEKASQGSPARLCPS